MSDPFSVRMRAFLLVASSRSVVRRALGYAVVVGAILVAINHGDALLAGDVDAPRALRIGLTILVPYVVSTLSSVQATRSAAPAADGVLGTDGP